MDYVEIKCDGDTCCRVSWEQVEGGIHFDEMLDRIMDCLKGAGWSAGLVDKITTEEIK